MEVQINATGTLKIEADMLGTFVGRLHGITVFGLWFEVLPQPSPSTAAIVNAGGECTFPPCDRAGLSVMLVAKDVFGESLWACTLKSLIGDGTFLPLEDSILADTEIVGRTTHIEIRAAGFVGHQRAE